MKYTNNLNLKKPEQTEFYDVDDFNYNADILDTEITLKLTNYTSLSAIGLTDSVTWSDIYGNLHYPSRLVFYAGSDTLKTNLQLPVANGLLIVERATNTIMKIKYISDFSSDNPVYYENVYYNGDLQKWKNHDDLKILINENTFRNQALTSAMVNTISTMFVEVFADTSDVDSTGDASTAIANYFDSDSHIFNKTDSATVTIYSKAKTVTTGNSKGWLFADYTLNGGSIEFAISRDGGNTYTVLTHNALTDISGQPSGTSMICRVKMTGALVFNNIAWGCK